MTICERRSTMPAAADQLFAWRVRPGTCERLLPPWLEIRLAERPTAVADGSRVVADIGRRPLRHHWVTRYRDGIPGRQLIEEQVKGPLTRWEHIQRFVPDGDGSSWLEDRVEYALPLGAVGRLAGGALVAPRLRRWLAFQHRRTRDDLSRHQAVAERPRLRVAISGSSGLVGSQLAAFLTGGGHEVLRLVRRAPAGADEVAWDPARGTLDVRDLQGIDAFVHLAGANIAAGRWTPARKRMILESRTRATDLVARTLARLDTPPVLLVASAIGLYGDRGDEALSEQSVAGAGFLSDVCRQWEAAAEPAVAAGLRVAWVRTGIVLTSRGGVLARMLPLFRLGAGAQLDGGRQWMSWISLDDVLGIYHHLLFADDLSGPVNATAPHAVTNREFTHVLAGVLRRPAMARLPAVAVRALYGEMGQELLLAGQRVLPARLTEGAYDFLHPDLETALRFELGRPQG
jgi:uncharacterized protein